MKGILDNITFWSAVIALCLAQGVKPVLHLLLGKGWDWGMIITTGGMPSSHTALVTAITASVAITEGLGSPVFTVSLALSLIVMIDALTVRYETGKQAEILNEWSEYFQKLHKNGPFEQDTLKTMVGHSFLQVAAGLLLGVATGIIVSLVMLSWR